MFAITVIILLPVSFAFGAQKPVLTASNKHLVEIIRKAKEDEVSAKIDEALILGADINRRDAFGNTVLMTVLYDRWTEKTSCYLISKGADLSVVNMSGETAAHIAARKQQYRALYLIAKRKGPLNTANIYGEKPVDRFLKNGDGATLYHWKAVTGNARSFGKDRRYESARDEQQKTPADYAAMAGNFETYSVLMGKSFDMKRDVGRIRSHISAFIKFKDFHIFRLHFYYFSAPFFTCFSIHLLYKLKKWTRLIHSLYIDKQSRQYLSILRINTTQHTTVVDTG